LHVDPNVAVLGFVGRLTWQKGIDIVQQGVADWMMRDEGNGVTGHTQLILMGNGDAHLSDWLKAMENQYKGRVCGYAGFDPKVERSMMAGCDFLLMPSRYEPCGIPQMVALAYGTVPIVHATGGLKDSVKDARSEDPEVRANANGYYVCPLSADKMKESLWVALETYIKNRPEHIRLMKNGMNEDFYWSKAIEEYERHFDYTFCDPPYYKI
jgi:starch synthase